MSFEASSTLIFITILLRLTSIHYHCLESKPDAINWLIDKDGNTDYSTEYADNSFYRMITQNQAFVDKSSFIKDILTDKHKILSITCPHGFGKTINMDMLKSFVKIEALDDGTRIPSNSTPHYELFKNAKLPVKGRTLRLKKKLSVSNYEDLFENSLGRYPVIHLNFEGFEAKSHENYFVNLKTVIARSFAEHKYMSNVLQPETNTSHNNLLETDKKKFDKYLKADISEREIIDGVRFLSGILNIHFESDVIVLIDQTELPIRKLISSSNASTFRDDAINLYLNMIHGALTENPFLYKGLMTGILPMTFREEFQSFVYYEFLDNDFIDKYYGFDEHEVEELFDHYKIETKLRHRAKDYYNGYEHHKKHPCARFYSPLSITKFLREKQCAPYSMEPTALAILDDFKKTGIFVEMFANLMIRKPHPEYMFLLPPQDPIQLYDIINSYRNLDASVTDKYTHKLVVNDFFEVMFRYMLANGYVSWCRHDDKTAIRISNEEVYSVIKNKLYDYFEKIAQHNSQSWNARVRAQTAWNEFLVAAEVDETTMIHLKTILKEFFNSQPEPVTSLEMLLFPHIVTYRDLHYAPLEITSLMNPSEVTFIDTNFFDNFELNQIVEKLVPNIVLVRGEKSTVIEFKSSRKFDEAARQAKKYETAYKFFDKFRDIKQLKYIGCHVDGNKETILKVAVIPFNWYENNTFHPKVQN